jgi:hypothetical protein
MKSTRKRPVVLLIRAIALAGAAVQGVVVIRRGFVSAMFRKRRS